MSALQHSVAPSFHCRPSPGVRMRIAVIGLTLLIPACSPEGSPAGNAQNGTAATPVRASATPPTASADPGVSAQIADKRRKLVGDAVSALQETYAALDLLTAGKADDAVNALSRATGKLDVVLAAEPDLALAPVDVRVATHDVIATPADVKRLRDLAEAALDDGRVQEARHLIAGLASEHVISTVSLPLATYPTAIKQAAARIHSGNTAEAAALLQTALATLVVEDTIVPLPLARAEALLGLAQPLAEKAQRSADENVRLQRMLADARLQLELATALGYATRQDLDALSDELKAIEGKTGGNGSGLGLFDRIKELFSQANRQANTRPPSEPTGREP